MCCIKVMLPFTVTLIATLAQSYYMIVLGVIVCTYSRTSWRHSCSLHVDTVNELVRVNDNSGYMMEHTGSQLCD